MTRYWQIYQQFVRSSLVRELEFRANFIAKLIQNGTWVLFFYFIIEVIYLSTDSIVGWNRGQALAVAACAMLVHNSYYVFFMSLNEIPELIRKGTLDFVITKPVDSQFWVSTRRFNFNELGASIVAIGLLCYAASQSGSNITPSNIGAFLILLISAVITFYSISLALMTLAVYFVRVDNLWVLAGTSLEIARFPVDIFNFNVRQFLTYVFPLAFLGTMPAAALVGKAPPYTPIIGVTFAVTSFILSRIYWRYSLQHYTSASS